MDPATIALVAGAALSSAASVYNNTRNIKYASEANDASISLANTAHQREVRDLEAAGLNPILSASSSGAATPQLRTPSLESIDGGISHSSGSLARAINGQMQAESDLAKADATSAKAEAENAARVARSNADLVESESRLRRIENDAKADALDGTVTLDHYHGNGSYGDLVQQHRNEVESGKYLSSLGHAIYDDVRSGISSASDVVGALKGIKALTPSKVEEESSIDRYDRQGHRVGSEWRSRSRVRR